MPPPIKTSTEICVDGVIFLRGKSGILLEKAIGPSTGSLADHTNNDWYFLTQEETELAVEPNMPLPGGGFLAPAVTSVSLFEAKEGFEELLLEELSRYVRNSRQELGNILFDLYRITGRRWMLILHEVWESPGAKEVHSRQFHTTRFQLAVENYLASPAQIIGLEALL